MVNKTTARVDFFVVGAARSGTTSLYQYLSQHPEVYLPKVKELNYFSAVTSDQYQDYQEPKPNKDYHTKIIQSAEVYDRLFQDAASGQLKGDVSPSYLWHKETAQRIAAHNPKAKILVTLRHPAKRAFSHYLMAKSVGYDRSETFQQALDAPIKPTWGGGNDYLAWSAYAAPLKAYYAAFPAEQIKVLVFEQWIRDQENTLGEVTSFLGLKPFEGFDLADQHNHILAYKHQGILNFFRVKWARALLHRLFSEGLRNRAKAVLFGGKPTKETLAPALQQKLEKEFTKEARAIEGLIGQSLHKLWGF
ncbi:MAG: hypothetical protein ABR84_05915 [Cryomorphaceae bacterium BACL21 MAG-121220-bin10]|jgi:hypothetical protein|nr:MAG: hypothetical protein ABR84_05915 [Cryomorphaceae bacterium BACL21 MAG-121220-bin10]